MRAFGFILLLILAYGPLNWSFPWFVWAFAFVFSVADPRFTFHKSFKLWRDLMKSQALESAFDVLANTFGIAVLACMIWCFFGCAPKQSFDEDAMKTYSAISINPCNPRHCDMTIESERQDGSCLCVLPNSASSHAPWSD